MRRRQFLQLAAGAAAGTFLEQASGLTPSIRHIDLSIDPVSVELAPNVIVHTTGYNGQAPGPVLRMREGVPATISVSNRTAQAESVQWYGLGKIPEVVVEPGATQTIQLTPAASGTRWYRATSLVSNGSEGTGGNGQFGFLSVSPRHEISAFDQEVFLAIQHWSLPGSQLGERQAVRRYASFNDRLLGAGEPVRVRKGTRVLFRFLNASAHEEAFLHLPEHRFTVIALDGNPVPRAAAVGILAMAPGERIDAIVEMNSPGRWILGSTDDAERARGLGILIEYENQSGVARWSSPGTMDWSYVRFSAPYAFTPQADQVCSVFLEKNAVSSGFDWTFNGQRYSSLESLASQQGSRFRLKIMNTTDRSHSVHLPQRNFALTRIHQIPIAGVVKDTIRLERYSVLEADVIPSHRS